MSYASFLRNVPEILSQPTGIAAIASLGIHGAIAFILPLMPVESSKTVTKQTTTTKAPVGLSELSSSEQSRIPQPTTQPGIQSQLPPLPTQIAGLPSQQQLPPTIGGASTLLPPTPPTGSIGSLVPSTGSNSTLAPLEKASGFSITGLPRGGNSVQQFRNNIRNASRYNSTPTISSGVTPEISLGTNRNFNNDLGYNRQQINSSRADRLASLPSTGPMNVPVNPPSLSTGDMVTPPIGDTSSNYNNLNNLNSVPENNNRVEPGRYIAPVDRLQAVGNSNFQVATGVMPLPTYQPQPGSALDNLNKPSGSTTEGIENNQNTQQNTSNALDDAKLFASFKNEYPQGELRAPINLTMNPTQLDTNVKASLIMDGEGKIADLKLLGDAAKLPFPKQQAIKERLQQYFKENPTSTNGKGALFSFQITPSTITQSGNTGSGALQNQTSGQSASATNDIMSRLSGSQSNRNQTQKTVQEAPSVSTSAVNSPINNTNKTPNSTQAPVLPPTLPGPLKPVNTLPQGQVILPSLPQQKPISSSNGLPQTLRNVEVAPQVVPTKPASEQTTTTSQSSRNTLVSKLRSTQPSESNSEMSLVEKLRKVRQEREKVNQENTNP
ncbi:hypothetical protein NIES4071_66920 [Calothrix sp. NIES-4071]|nr:hypothetical protein NIES4071_66920 [Calothrix sp. NIES-4071]BAZ60970.1 hypothetical protein NIES4105_66880 [Calothrix sp. NIES-4105]